ncbi:MAG: trypsin-like peptidase domain-containing protein [Clostridia bacterium]|nr:trypsin-like peptidase domain-containing protein [Clostridia bacterium]
MKNSKRTFIAMLAMAFAVAVAGGAVGSFIFARNAAAEESGTVGYEAIFTAANPVPEIAANVRPSVVQVITSGETWISGPNATEQDLGSGSGSYIRALDGGKGGYILTNNHVIEGGEKYRIMWLDGTEMDAELVGADSGTDIAVLKFEDEAPEGATPVVLGDSDGLQIGELAIVIGNPGAGDSVLFGTVSAGIISGLERSDVSAGNFSRSVSVIQTDAAINSGNSGGALLNSRGELVGIPTLKMSYSYSSVYEGLGFCVPINTVKPLVEQIIDTGKVTRPMLGIGVSDFDGPDEPIRSHPPIGVKVQQVVEGSSAEEQGVKVYDVITEIDGVRIKSYTELTAEVDKHKVGDVVELKIYRYYDERGDKLDKYEEHAFSVELRALED